MFDVDGQLVREGEVHSFVYVDICEKKKKIFLSTSRDLETFRAALIPPL